MAAPADLSTISVYVVDDDLSVRRALERVLKTAGYSVETFASGQEFLDSDPQSADGCVVLDIHLGGMSGLEVQESLAARRVGIPIIVITAHDNAITRARVERLGAVAYLPKPIDESVLLDAIRTAIRRREFER